MQKDNLDLLVEQLFSEDNWWDSDSIIKSPYGGKYDSKKGAYVQNYNGPGSQSSAYDPNEHKKYNQPITLVADNGEKYTIYPNDQFREIDDKRKLHNQNSVSPQRGMNRSNRFALQYGGINDEKYHDNDEISVNNVENSHILSYNQFNNNPTFQGLLGKALLKFYKDNNISSERQPLQINYKKVKSHYDLINALNHKSDNYDPILATQLRSAKTPEERLKIIKQYNKYKDAEQYPASSHVARADEIDDDRINKIYDYKRNLSNFKNNYVALNSFDRGLFDKIQKIITNPRQTGSTQMSPKDLTLLLNNYKDLSNNSKNADEIRDNWEKLRRGDLKYHESCFSIHENLLTEEEYNPKPINYYQAILFDIITKSGTFFAPQEDSMLGASYMDLFRDHWKDISPEFIRNGNNKEIYQAWNELIEKYLLDYYVPKVINWLRFNSPLGNQFADIQDVVNKLKFKFKSVFEFINQYDFKDRKEIIYELITGNELKHDTKAQKVMQKDKDNQDLLNRYADFYANGVNGIDYGESIEESQFDKMITKVLKELIEKD